MKLEKLFFFLCIFFMVSPRGYAAYTDEISARGEQIWRAAREVLEPYGLAKEDVKKGVLESKWVEDYVRRSHKFLPEGIKKGYLRRYKIVIKLTEGTGKTLVEIKGKFQQKETGLPPAAPWRPVEAKTEDYEVERMFFSMLIAHLNRNFSPPA